MPVGRGGGVSSDPIDGGGDNLMASVPNHAVGPTADAAAPIVDDVHVVATSTLHATGWIFDG